MANAVSEWILREVHREVEAALLLREQHETGVFQGGNASHDWRSDGTLVVSSSKHHNVQLINFIHRKPPYTAWVSDTQTRIRATFQTEAITDFKKRYDRPLIERTEGGVLDIAEYYLTIDPTETPSKRVKLTIQEFSLSGSEGSSSFGQPRTIADVHELQDIISRVQQNVSMVSAGTESEVGSPSSVKSQTDGIFYEAASQLPTWATQAPFATQAANFQNPPMNSRIQSKPRNKSPTPQSHSTLESQNAHLLALLKGQESVSVAAGATTAEARTIIDGTPPPLIESHVSEDTSSLQPKANARASSLFAGSKDLEMSQSRAPMQERLEVHGRATSDTLNDSEKENSQEETKTLVITLESKVLPSSSPTQGDAPATRSSEVFPNPWAGYIHMPLKFVQIPKEQRTLLDRDDSWDSPGLAKGTMHINVPSTVIHDLQVFYDQNITPTIENDIESQVTRIERNAGIRNKVNRSNQATALISERSSQDLAVHSFSKTPFDSQHAAHEEIEDNLDDDVNMETLSWSPTPSRDLHGSSAFKLASVSGTAVHHENYNDAHSDINESETSLSESGTDGNQDQHQDQDQDIGDFKQHEPFPEPLKSISRRRHQDGKRLPPLEPPPASLGKAANSQSNHIDNLELAKSSQVPSRTPDKSISTLKSNLASDSELPNSPQLPLSASYRSFSRRNSSSQSSNAESLNSRESSSSCGEDIDNQIAKPSLKFRMEGMPQPSQVFSSSPTEMESVVPYAVDEHFPSSYKLTHMDKRSESNQAMVGKPSPELQVEHVSSSTNIAGQTKLFQSANGRRGPNLQVSRTPNVPSYCRRMRPAGEEFCDDGDNELDSGMIKLSSDPIIPGTIDSDGEGCQVPSTNVPFQAGDTHRADGHNLSTTYLVSTPQSSPTRQTVTLFSPIGQANRDELADEQLRGEFQTYSQDCLLRQMSGSPIGNPNSSPYLGDIQAVSISKAKVSRASTSSPTQATIPSTQLFAVSDHVTFDSLRSEDIGPFVHKLSSKLTQPATAQVSDTSPKRQLPSDPDEIVFSQADRPKADVNEMIKANKRAFMSRFPRDPAVEPPGPLSLSKSPPQAGTEKDEFRQSEPDYTKTVAPAAEQESQPPSDGIQTASNQVKYLPTANHITNIHVARGKICRDVAQIASSTSKVVRTTDDYQVVDEQESSEFTHNSLESNDSAPRPFDRYTSTYPTFMASQRRFLKACVYLDWLKFESKRAPHPSLWDDFIRAFCHDYVKYIGSSRDLGVKPVPAIDFYNDQVVPDSDFNKCIVTAAALQEILRLNPTETEKARKSFRIASNIASRRGSSLFFSPRSSVGHDTNDVSFEYSRQSLSQHELHKQGQLEKHSSLLSSSQNIPFGSTELSSQAQILDAASAFYQDAAPKKPFFETPSQLSSKTLPIPTDSPAFSTHQNKDVTSEAEISAVRSSQKVLKRRLPWSSSPVAATEYVPLFGQVDEKSDASDIAYDFRSRTTGHFQGIEEQQTAHHETLMTQTQGSPILGYISPQKLVSDSKGPSISEGSPILGTRTFPAMRTRQEVFRTSEPPDRRIASIPRGEVKSLDNLTANSGTPPFSVPAKRVASPGSSPHISSKRATLAFEEFSTTFGPRRSRLTTPSLRSVHSPVVSLPRVDQPRIVELKLQDEPETQDWNWGMNGL